MTRSTLPSYRELPLRGGLPSAWDVWTEPDARYFGCLNLLTPERVAEAATEVRKGAVFAMNWSMREPNPPLFGRKGFEHEVTGDDRATSHDDVLHNWNTQSSSQWDGFRHIRNFAAQADEPGTGHFGGVPDDEHGMHHWAQRGIVGRAVLADIGRWRASIGRPLRYDTADPIEATEIAECLAHQGTELREGDILLMRTGWMEWYSQQSEAERTRLAVVSELATPGLRSDEATAEVLWDLHIAALGADNPAVEVWPPGALRSKDETAAVRGDKRRMHEIFTHTLFLPMLGLPLGEMFVLDALAKDCAEDGRYSGFFTSAPLNLPSGVASPPNALVIK
jgi:kynurenine formamidase